MAGSMPASTPSSLRPVWLGFLTIAAVCAFLAACEQVLAIPAPVISPTATEVVPPTPTLPAEVVAFQEQGTYPTIDQEILDQFGNSFPEVRVEGELLVADGGPLGEASYENGEWKLQAPELAADLVQLVGQQIAEEHGYATWQEYVSADDNLPDDLSASTLIGLAISARPERLLRADLDGLGESLLLIGSFRDLGEPILFLVAVTDPTYRLTPVIGTLDVHPYLDGSYYIYSDFAHHPPEMESLLYSGEEIIPRLNQAISEEGNILLTSSAHTMFLDADWEGPINPFESARRHEVAPDIWPEFSLGFWPLVEDLYNAENSAIRAYRRQRPDLCHDCNNDAWLRDYLDWLKSGNFTNSDRGATFLFGPYISFVEH